MRVLLIQTAKGLFSSSGGYKANNALLRYLASNGHRVRQLCYSHSGEIESYTQARRSHGEPNTRLGTKVLHIRSEDGQPGVDVKVHELCMDDGVEVVALDSDSFDAAKLPPCVNQEDLWRDIKVLIVPSLWCEAWGMVVVEAHLRGIPVVSSDAGALPEAMLGLDYIIPVNRISGERDESGGYIIPEQRIKPWAEVIARLMESRAEYEKVSVHVRNTTKRWLEK
ncbi:hypothetical protein ACLX1H_008897 [Fusarium chlamydosporum]